MLTRRQHLILTTFATGTYSDTAMREELGLSRFKYDTELRELRQRFDARTLFGAFEAARAAGLLAGVPAGDRWWWLRVEVGDPARPGVRVGAVSAGWAFAEESAAHTALRCLAGCQTSGHSVLAMLMRPAAPSGQWREAQARPSCDQVPATVRTALSTSLRWTGPDPHAFEAAAGDMRLAAL